MNKDNYGSLEACQRLHATGIVLETDAIWEYDDPCSDPTDPAWNQHGEWKLIYKPYKIGQMHNRQVPAPCFTDVWRELPEGTTLLRGHGGSTCFNSEWSCVNINPTDALIDLLIEQRKEK